MIILSSSDTPINTFQLNLRNWTRIKNNPTIPIVNWKLKEVILINGDVTDCLSRPESVRLRFALPSCQRGMMGNNIFIVAFGLQLNQVILAYPKSCTVSALPPGQKYWFNLKKNLHIDRFYSRIFCIQGWPQGILAAKSVGFHSIQPNLPASSEQITHINPKYVVGDAYPTQLR